MGNHPLICIARHKAPCRVKWALRDPLPIVNRPLVTCIVNHKAPCRVKWAPRGPMEPRAWGRAAPADTKKVEGPDQVRKVEGPNKVNSKGWINRTARGLREEHCGVVCRRNLIIV
uniref:Uncharacterized protein n=1 Tax=Cacopsylla melanoneura TaxID=428564 RepID=A0A8D9FGJ6_9HEMI